MPSFHEFTTAQLKQAVQIREQIESLQAKLNALLGGTTTPAKAGRTKRKRTISPEHRANLAAAQQARWSKLKGTTAKAKSKKSTPAKSAPKKRVFSPETKAKLAVAMKARWAAKKKAAGAE